MYLVSALLKTLKRASFNGVFRSGIFQTFVKIVAFLMSIFFPKKKRLNWVLFAYFSLLSMQFLLSKNRRKFLSPKLKNQICGFVGNVNADLGLSWCPYRTRFGPSTADFWFKNEHFFSKKWFLWFVDKSADNNKKMLGKVVYRLF